MYGYKEREITKEEFEEIEEGKRSVYSFFSEAAVMGYGLLAYKPIERDGKYYIPYDISDSCD